jgi:oxygen-dependent protoporphyrinogen oxidase
VPRVVVVGGGISGLAAAWAAKAQAPCVPGGLDVIVFERGVEVGGKARSIVRDGWLLEGGPGGFLSGRPEMDRVIAGSGLVAELVPAGGVAARRFLYRAGRMRRIVPNPVGLVAGGVLSAGGAARMLAEPFMPRRVDDADESVRDFAARRLGPEVADRLVLPMALGIFAGDARRLSLPAAFPRMAALERDHGSLILGMIAKRGQMSSGTLMSFRSGLQALPRALAARGGCTVRTRADVRALVSDGSRWRVVVGGEPEAIAADAVILAGEPWAMAALARPLSRALADELAAIPCPPIAVVGLGFGGEAARRVPRGFGVLISRGEGFRMLGNLWDTHIFPGRGPHGRVLVRAMFGGAVDPDVAALSDAELLDLARAEVARLYGIRARAEFEEVVRIPRAIPQYELGHRERVERIERALQALPGLDLTGFGLRGIAFADAASDGVRTGERVARRLAARPARGGETMPAPVDTMAGTLQIR